MPNAHESASVHNGLPHRPRPSVRLIGTDGNVFALLAKARCALEVAGWSNAESEAFLNEAINGDYNHVLAVIQKYMDVD